MKHSLGTFSEKSVFSNKPMVLKDWAYEQIKRWILEREIAPGAPLIINDLANEMNISSTPVRDALHRLEIEGLVQVRPRLGFYVAEITQDDLKNLFELRILLEGYAAEKVTTLLTDEEVKTLFAMFDKCTEAEDEESSQKFQISDHIFHTTILERTQNPKLLQIMDQLQDLTHKGVALGTTSYNNIEKSCREHKQILEAMRTRDARAAGQLMREHLTLVMERLLAMLNTQETLNSDKKNPAEGE